MDLARRRSLFPVCQNYIYFNHAAVSPLATPARRAMETTLAELNESGAFEWQRWIAALDRTRASLARLVGASSAEIAFAKNTSAGLGLVAHGLDWRPGDRVVTFECEFPANLYPWLALRDRGVQVDLLPEADLADLDRVRKACRSARLLSISFVQYLSGFRADLAAIGQICHETGTLLLVDAIQGLGAFPLNVKQCQIHFLAADGHKWLTGPEGAGFAFIDESVLDQLTPREVGWLSVSNWEDFTAPVHAASTPGPLPWHADARRFECGTYNTVGLIGLGAAVDLLLEIGVDAIAQHVLDLGDSLIKGLQSYEYNIVGGNFVRHHRSGITSFRHPRHTAEELVKRLLTHKIVCAARNGCVRIAPHLYNSPAEVASFLAHLS